MKRAKLALFCLIIFLIGQFSKEAIAGISDLANGLTKPFLNFYYDHASQRKWDEEIISEKIPFPPASWEGRNLYLIKGMTNFRPSSPYLKSLEMVGFKVHTFPPVEEPNLFQSWPTKAGNLILYFVEHPEEIQKEAIYVGHSTGGLVVYTLAVIAKGGDLESIRREIPELQKISLSDLEEFATRLRESDPLFITIATPFNGIRLTSVGEIAYEISSDPEAFKFVDSLKQDYIHHFYNVIGLTPNQVIGGNIIGEAGSLFHKEGNFRSWAIRGFIQVSLRFFGSFTEPDGKESDGIVYESSASLTGVEQKKIPLDHLALVETPEAVFVLLDLIQTLESFENQKSSPAKAFHY